MSIQIPEGLPQPTSEALEQEHPVDMSLKGHNSFYHTCNLLEKRQSYAVCLNAVEATHRGVKNVCEKFITCGTCPAMKMRNVELDAGRALYFNDRNAAIARRGEAETPSSSFGYGRKRSAPPALSFRRPASNSTGGFEIRIGGKSHSTPKKSELQVIDAKVVGRSLLGEAIDNMMKEKK